MVIEFHDVTSPDALGPLDPARPWLPVAATFIDVTDEPGLSTDLQVFCAYSPESGLAVRELGLVLSDGVADLGTAPPTGVDLRGILRRALRAFAGDEVTDAEIEEVLPLPADDERVLRVVASDLTVLPAVDPWFFAAYGETDEVYELVTPDLCVPTVVEVFAVAEPQSDHAIVLMLVLDRESRRYQVVHVAIRQDHGAGDDLGADPFRGVDLDSLVRRALVGIAPTGDRDLTLESFLPPSTA